MKVTNDMYLGTKEHICRMNEADTGQQVARLPDRYMVIIIIMF
jgi:hypothetical protein